MGWTKTDPQGSTKVSDSPTIFQGNWTAIENWTNTEHGSLASATSGMHIPGYAGVVWTGAQSALSGALSTPPTGALAIASASSDGLLRLYVNTSSAGSGTWSEQNLPYVKTNAVTITATNVSATNFSGINAYATTITATTISGTSFSGTNSYVDTVTATSINATTITATIVSGAISADTVKAATITATTISGTSFSGTNAYVTTVSATNVSATNITATNITATTLTATTISGSALCATTISATNYLNISSTIADGSITTAKLGDFAVTRGAYNYTAGVITLTSTTETEIGSLTTVTNDVDDSVWLWSQVTITQPGLNGSKGSQPVGLKFRIRRDSTTGTEVGGGVGFGFGGFGTYNDTTPIVCIASDVPGGSTGNHVYKLTVQASSTPDSQSATVAYRTLMCLTRSK